MLNPNNQVMEKKREKIQDQKQVPKEVGSNLTGTALKGKPGHERDIDTKTFEEASSSAPPDKPGSPKG